MKAGDTLRAEGTVTEVSGDGVVIQQRLMNGERIVAECTSSLSLR